MVAGVRVSFGLTKDEVSPALNNQVRGYKASKRSIDEVKASFNDYERVALRAYRRQQTEQQRINSLAQGLGRLVEKEKITREAAVATLTAERRRIQQNNGLRKESVGLTTQLRNVAHEVVGSYVSIGGAIALANQGLQESVELERRRQEVTRESIDARTNFALLNRGRIAEETAEVRRIGAQFGFGRNAEEEQVLFDAAQSFQSQIPGEVDGRRALVSALGARLVGIELETAKELATQAINRGESDPATFVRRCTAC